MNAHPRPETRPRIARAALASAIVLAGFAGCGKWADDVFCDAPGCGFSNEDWGRISSLAHLGPPPADPSNAFVNNEGAAQLGQAFYNDARFSGTATQVDALGRPAAVPRAPKGQAVNLSCASCHDLGRAGVDVASTPGNVSSGAGWTDVNAAATVDSAYQHLFFWNGRADSLWGLAVAVAESPTTMNGNRLQTAWVINDFYRLDYQNVFGSLPMPPGDPSCDGVMLETAGPLVGQCQLMGGACPPPCRAGSGSTLPDPGCWPQFPLQGKPGSKAGCQAGDATEPFGDAFDCMDPNDQLSVTRVLVNWAKALEAFQYLLRDRAQVGAPLDQWVAAGPQVAVVSEAARRGAQLFVGKGSCIGCHNTPLLSDGQFHDIAVAQVGPDVPTLADCFAGNAACDCVNGTRCLPWGAYDGRQKLAASKFLRTSQWSDAPTDGSRAADVATKPTDLMKGAWRTPSLRNVALTAPYMHDGRYATLAEVVDHYNRGGDANAVGRRDVEIKPLLLTDDEQADLVEFLGTLTEPPLEAGIVAAPKLPTGPVCP
jgi:cytochrome c peroxidase